MIENESIDRRRKIVDIVARGACVAATVLAVIPLLLVLYYVAAKGLGGVNWDFFTHLKTPVGEPGGGMANAIVGTLILVGLACCFGIPVGVMAGVYLAEIDRRSPFAKTVRFCADLLAGIPSIVVGLFVYALIVIRTHHFTAWSGGVALAILMLPTVTRTTEEMLLLVPDSLREAAFALGVPRWKMILKVALRTALPGIATGIMLAVARVAGETAPLLFTAFGNDHMSTKLGEPIGSLPQSIYTYAISPYDDWHRQASAAALVLVAMVLVLNIIARLFVRRRRT